MNATEYIQKANELIGQGEWDKAIVNLKFAEKLEPDNPMMHLFFFNAYGMTRNNAEAKKHFLAFQALQPADAKTILDKMPDFIREDLGL